MHTDFRIRYSGLGWILCALAFAVGCLSPAVHKNVPAFASAVTLATENTKSAFDVVEQEYENVQAERIVVNYDREGFNPNMVKQFLGPEDLEVRLALLDALQHYASTLAEVSGDKQLDQFDDKTRALGSSLQSLTKTAAFQRLVTSSAMEVNIAATAINALGQWFIERKRQQQLPRLISDMQEPVRRTAELLQADIGSAPDDHGHGGHGLREQLWNEYTQAALQQVAFIDHNKDHMDPASKAEAIKKLPQLVRQRALADQTLKQTQVTLSKLVEAHSALLRAVQSKTDIQAEFSALIGEGQRIKSFYDSLQKKG
ncbi:MAG TPA: hypothetical protein VEV41_24705 [Terriglobales bacterium]|nr:hypothetical protein [Terriglobales bacterium]